MTHRCCTGEAWQLIMLACLGDQDCEEGSLLPNGECGSNFAYIYFTSFVFLSSFLVSSIYSIIYYIVYSVIDYIVYSIIYYIVYSIVYYIIYSIIYYIVYSIIYYIVYSIMY